MVDIKYRKWLLFMMMGILFTSCHQLTIEVNKVPSNTPDDAAIFASGNFNNWDPGDDKYRLEKISDSSWAVKLPIGFGSIEYKFTRGDWTTVEKDPCGYDMANRTFRYGDSSIIIDSIESWNDLDPIDCPQVTLILEKIPQNTPEGSRISLAGSINNWESESEEFEFRQEKNDKLNLTIRRPADLKSMQFKITRGSLDRAESDALGNELPPREIVFGQSDTIMVSVEGWEDLATNSENMLTVIVNIIPQTTPPGDDIYIVGNFNDWYPRQQSLILEKGSSGMYFIRLPKSEDLFEFKFTRGGWSTVEVDKYGYDIENRTVDTKTTDTVYIEIQNWIDLKAKSDSKFRIYIDKLPLNTPAEDKIFIAGNFNGWDPNSRKYVFSKNSQGSYYIDIQRDWGTLEFKITRGSWGKVEVQANGEDIENRRYPYKDIEEIHISVERWKDL